MKPETLAELRADHDRYTARLTALRSRMLKLERARRSIEQLFKAHGIEVGREPDSEDAVFRLAGRSLRQVCIHAVARFAPRSAKPIDVTRLIEKSDWWEENGHDYKTRLPQLIRNTLADLFKDGQLLRVQGRYSIDGQPTTEGED